MRSNPMEEGDPRRIFPRPLLASLAGALAVALAIPGPWVGPGAAQEAPSGPTIKFINPSDYADFRAASDRDMEQHGYHIVTGVSNTPAQARVEVEIESSSAGRRRIGTASQDRPGTFALHWQIPPSEELSSGTYTMKAILFSGQTQVAEDEISVSVQPSWPTVRIDAPSNGGRMGLYQPIGNEGRWHTVIDYTFSSGTEIVAFFYSLTPPGQEPEWHGCGDVRVSTTPGGALLGGGAAEPESRRHLCEFDAEHDGQEVTAVAAVATDDPWPLPRMGDALLFGDTSGDAHSVIPYRQVPANVNLSVEGSEPGTVGPHQYATDSCTNQIVARVTDQHGRPVARANVDVHASGPEATEGRAALRFDVSTGSSGTDANQPPDRNHSDEIDAWSCAGRSPIQGPGPSGTQGNHRVPDGPDVRHIESGGAGTNPAGRFRFRLYNDQLGGTQITAWADLDDDDRYCSLEPAGHLSIGWSQLPPAVQGHAPELNDCEIPGVAGAAQVQHHARTMGINFGRSGGRLVVRGRVRVRSGHRPCHRNVPVRVQRRQGNRWVNLRMVRTNGQGRYRALVAHRNGRYRVIALHIVKGANDQHICRRTAARGRYRGAGSGGRQTSMPLPPPKPTNHPATELPGPTTPDGTVDL